MNEFGLNIKTDTGGKRVELECEHQNGLLYVVPAESSWVCSEELIQRTLWRASSGSLSSGWRSSAVGIILPPEAAGGGYVMDSSS